MRSGLERKGINVLGVLPFDPMLSHPTFEQIIEEIGFEVICGKENLERPVSRVIVGAMEPRDAVKYIIEDSLMITPGDRQDMIMTALSCFCDQDDKKLKVSGMILSGGITPDQPVMNLLQKSGIPVLLAKTDTYDVATVIHDLTVKIRPCDKDKIDAVVKLVKDNINLDKILKGI